MKINLVGVNPRTYVYEFNGKIIVVEHQGLSVEVVNKLFEEAVAELLLAAVKVQGEGA